MNKEIWKVIPGYEAYEASSSGQIRRRCDHWNGYKAGMVLSQGKPTAYYVVRLTNSDQTKQKNICVHRLVLLAFHGQPPKPDYVGNHKNLNKLDNRIENLEWVSRSENAQHAVRNGKMLNRQYNPRLGSGEDFVIKELYQLAGPKSLATCFGVDRTRVWQVWRNE